MLSIILSSYHKALKTHERDAHQPGRKQREREPFENFDDVGTVLIFFPYPHHQRNGQRKTDARARAVDHGLYQVITLFYVDQRDAKYRAIRRNKREIYAEQRVQRGKVFFQEHFQKLDNRRDNQYKYNRIQIRYIERQQYVRIKEVGHRGGQRHDEEHGDPHAKRRLSFFGDAKKGAHAQKI